jgi:two-component system, sensor histidine kinase and response regulator
MESDKNSRILIVDDNPQNLQVLGRLLLEKNYDLEFATNGKAALEWLEFQQFDLVLLDINMPDMNGYEVCKRIRANETLNRVPVIFLSVDSDRESILKGFEHGAQDYVTKPFDSRELLVRVKTHLSLKESLEKLEKLNKTLEEKVRERTLQLSIANEHLESMNTKLTELDDAKSEFLRLISHEISTPLNGILLPVELLKDPISPSETRVLIEILDASVKRLEKFSGNALLITRLKTRPQEIKKEDLLIGTIIDEVIQEVQGGLIKKGLTVKENRGDISYKISGEAELVKKCIFNIVDNAVTFSPPGSSIEINTYVEDQQAVIEVSDYGKGIPQVIIDKGAEPFSRGKDYQDKSTGIGLPLAKMIMEAHNGVIELKNRPEGGASVILRFRLI